MKLDTKIFADGANLTEIEELNKNKLISGFTTNPSLMKKAGIKNYEAFAKDALSIIENKPISFEVFSDDLDEMREQALKIASWGQNVYVKLPITNTKGESIHKIAKSLTENGVKLNITAIMTFEQVENILPSLMNSKGAYMSIFAGRIADTGIDPIPILKDTIKLLSSNKKIELIWASPREVFNIIQSSEIKCHIITVTSTILNKLSLLEKNLNEYSIETVKDFYQDAVSAGYKL